jgi:uncharacterized protein YjbJ (UPF0337 family)
MILASLVPASEREQDLVESAEQQARGPLQEKAGEVADQLKEPVQHAVQQVKDTATQAVSATADDARSAADAVRQPFES